jgi:hypothetical protein
VTRTRIEGVQVLVFRPAQRWLVVASMAAALGVLSACGGSSGGGQNFPSGAGTVLPSGPVSESFNANIQASQLATNTFTDMRSAKSFHLVTNSKNKKITTVLDIHYSDVNSSGSVVIEKTKVLLIRIGEDVYVNGPDDFWKAELAPARATALLPKVHGKWVKNPTFAGTFTQVLRFTNKKVFIESVIGGSDASQFVKGADKVVNKVTTIPLTDHQSGAVLYVTKASKPYPVQATGSKGATTATSTFDLWEKPFTVTPPPASQVFVFTA